MKITLYITFIFAILSSCSKHSSVMSEDKALDIDCSEITNEVFKLSEIASSFSIIPLETNDTCLIGGVSKLKFYNDKILILDKILSARLFVFNKEGKYLFDIGRRGTGPDEYLQINDFSIDKKNSIIYVLCDKKKVFSYSLSGQYRGRTDVDFFADAMEYKDNRFYFVCDRMNRGNLIVTDMNGTIEYEDFPNEQMGDNLLILIHPFLQRDSTLLYTRYLDNNIYEIHLDTSKVAYKVNFGKDEIAFDDLKDIPHQKVKDKLAHSRGKIKYLIENKDYMQMLFFDNNIPCIAVYNKRNRTNSVHFFKNYIDDVTGLPSPLFEYVTEQDEFVAVVQPSIVGEIENLTEKGQEVFKSVDLSEDSNPILYLVKTK